MAPHLRGIAAHLASARRAPVRRVAAVAATALVIGATPFVATAFAGESTPPDPVLPAAVSVSPTARASSPRPSSAEPPAPESAARVDADPANDVPEPAIDPVMLTVTETYVWDEQGPRIVVLQEALGVAADGRYGHATLLAHRAAFAYLGLAIDALPLPALPPGPTDEQWAALRECESNGDYSIVSRSGKYRGAYQFGRSTWNSVAERHAPILVGVDPAEASPADQDAMAFALFTERGRQPWPVCGRHLS